MCIDFSPSYNRHVLRSTSSTTREFVLVVGVVLALAAALYLLLTFAATTTLTPYERAEQLLAQIKEWQISGSLASFPETLSSGDTGGLLEPTAVPVVPFYSQFADISDPSWRKVGCGIASIAMVIDYYSGEQVSVDSLLTSGIARGAYLSNAGWIHAGLIGLSRDYGLDGESRSLAALSADDAMAELSEVVSQGPVLASVHYTFEPTNPIPHLVVINAVHDGMVYYNDPAEVDGNGSLTVEKFQRAWKKRYIIVRPEGQLRV